jgi:hypothetical protein
VTLQDLGRDQPIGDDHLAARDALGGAQRDQTGVTRPGPDEIHKSSHFLGIPSP